MNKDPNSRQPNSNQVRRVAIRVVAAAIVVYALFFTFAGNTAYGLVLAALRPVVSNERFNSLCDLGNTSIDTFQPLVSDEQMIIHLSMHRATMERIAHEAMDGRIADPKGGISAEVRALMKDSQIKWVSTAGVWPPDATDERTPRRNIVALTPSFGRTTNGYHCSNRTVSTKVYKYYPQPTPIVANGRIVAGSVEIPSKLGSTIADNLDRADRHRCTARRIDEHWFLSIC